MINPFDFFLEPYAEKFPFRYEAGLAHELTPFLAVEAAGPQLAAFLKIDRPYDRRRRSIFWSASTKSCRTRSNM